VSAWRGWLVRLRRGLRPGAFEAEMAEEMRAHLELEADARRARGAAPLEARRTAALAFGHVESLKETVRDRRLGRWVAELAQDVRYAVRLLRKSPGFSAVVITTIALAVGGSATVFSTLDAALLRPLPFAAPDRLVQLVELLDDGQRNSVSGGAFLDWRAHATSLDSAVIMGGITANLREGTGPAERLTGARVSHELLRVFGVTPIAGRGFGPADDAAGGSNDVVLLTESLWRTRFAARAAVVGSTIRLDERPRTVIGVVPDGAALDRDLQFFVPAVLDPADRGQRAGHWAVVFGRMKPGVTVARLDAELKAVKARLNPAYPAFKRAWGVQALALQDELSAQARDPLLVLGGAVTLLLLIACANIANLLLARAWLRQREVALRAALGAGSGRLVRQLLTESAVLALAGGAAGVVLASLAIGVVASRAIDFLPPAMAPTLDLRVTGFALAVSVLTGLLFGVLPAWRARRPDLVETIRREGPTATARRPASHAALVVGQLALTVVLVVAAGLFGRSLVRAVTADPGFTPERVLAFDLSLPDASYPTPERRLDFSKQLLTVLRAQRGVRAAGTAMGVPFAGGGYGEFLSSLPQPQRGDLVLGRVDYVSEGFFEALGARLRSGRFPTADDNRRDAPAVCVINEAAARRLFGDADPVGRAVYFRGPSTVVGVVADVVDRRLDVAHRAQLYLMQARNPSEFSVIVGADGDPGRLAALVTRLVGGVDAGVAAVNVRTLDDAMARSMTDRRLVVWIVALFAVAALALATLGVYAVMADAVSARRRELCLRIALGAGRAHVLRSVAGSGLILAGVGLALGGAGAVAAGWGLRGLLFDVRPTDPLVFGAALTTIAVVAALATFGPAIRATRLDAIAALRE
jgi:putative ABC transport system permease protein